MKAALTKALALGLATTFAPAAPAEGAHVACGDVITTAVTLDGDVGPCTTDAALTIVGPGGSLDLNGFEVSCDGTLDTEGIQMVGTGAHLQDGTVRDCRDGIEMLEGGGHTALRVRAIDNHEDGFDIDSDFNFVTKCVASNNGSGEFENEGFEVDGENNQLTKNISFDNHDDGFDLNGDRNVLRKNLAYDNAEDGFDVDGDKNIIGQNDSVENGGDGFEVEGDENLLRHNLAEQNEDDGIDLEYGDRNHIGKNLCEDNADDGITMEGDHNLVRHNQSEDNADDGFDIEGFDNVIERNRADHNGDNGVQVSGDGNEIRRNKSFDSDDAMVGGVDMFESNAGCASNVWFENKFDTANEGCID